MLNVVIILSDYLINKTGLRAVCRRNIFAAVNLRRFARRLSPFLTIYLLMVSLGLPLHKVYCACRDVTNLSLFSGPHECGMDQEAMVAKKLAELGELAQFECCRKAALKSCQAPQNDQHNCGDEETILAKFTPDYLFGDSKALSDLTSWNGVLAVQAQLSNAFVALIPKALPIRGPDPPPPLYGRELLLRMELFLC